MSPAPELPRKTAQLLFRGYIEIGVSVSLCLALVALAVGLIAGLDAAISAAIGAMCVSIVDQAAPLLAKLKLFVAALLAGTAISLLTELASDQPIAMAAIIVVTSVGLALAAAFGRSALTLGVAGVLALVMGMAAPSPTPSAAVQAVGLFFIGGGAYALLALLVSWRLDDRNRRMVLNEALLAFAAYLRARAELYEPDVAVQPVLVTVIDRHGALMERLQAARDMIFAGAPTGARRKWIAGLLSLLDLYEIVLSSDADWESLREVPDREALRQLSALSQAMADDIGAVALSLVSSIGRIPDARHPDLLAALDATLERLAGEGRLDEMAALRPTRVKAARMMRRIRQLAAVLDPHADPVTPLPTLPFAVFVQPPIPLVSTLRGHLSLSSPVARYAIRLTLAMLAGYAVTIAFPAYVHGGWVLLTVALIMRASYATTKQRRNNRLIGTLAGCAVAAVLMPTLPPSAIVAIIIVAAGIAHAYGAVNYRIASFAASLMALLLLHFLEPQAFYVADRILDTTVGAILSIVFARVLPSWEWNDVPRLVSTLVEADLAFAVEALSLDPVDHEYRLARKRALDRFAALATSVSRLSGEPAPDSERLAALNELLAANYLFASDLASVQSLLHARADELDAPATSALLAEARQRVTAYLATAGAAPPPETLRRRGWFELRDLEPLTILRRRLLHIEHSAQRLAAQAARAGAAPSACPASALEGVVPGPP